MDDVCACGDDIGRKPSIVPRDRCTPHTSLDRGIKVYTANKTRIFILQPSLGMTYALCCHRIRGGACTSRSIWRTGCGLICRPPPPSPPRGRSRIRAPAGKGLTMVF
jgi:hypothetical protein